MNFINQPDEAILTLAKPIIEDMIEGTNTGNYELFSRHFAPQMQQLVTKKQFIEQREKNVPQFGELTEYQVLGCIKRPSGVSVIYKQKTSKTEAELLGQIYIDSEGESMKVFDACIN